MSANHFAILASCVSLLVACSAQAQGPSQPLPPERYLPRLEAAERATASVLSGSLRNPASDAMVVAKGKELQDLGTLRSFVGDTDGAIAAFDLLRHAGGFRAAEKAVAIPDDVRAEDAIKAIVEQARSKRVVLVNEAHHVPMHRAFTQRLATELRKIGYRYLACEDFAQHFGQADGRPPQPINVYTGYLMRDPVFAGLVNAALADGWTLVEYEYHAPREPGADPRARTAARELTQARNLVDRIFAKDKNAKVLIHVGYAHLYKASPNNPDIPIMMGEHLRRMTGLATLHVDQTWFHAHPDARHENPTYAHLIERFPSQQPFVLRAGDGSHPVLLGQQGNVDMQVIFPRYPMVQGRPDWLRTLLGRRPHAIPTALLPKEGRRLIKAYRMDDNAIAVPTDMVLVEAGKPMPVLMLPEGEFRFEYEDEAR